MPSHHSTVRRDERRPCVCRRMDQQTHSPPPERKEDKENADQTVTDLTAADEPADMDVDDVSRPYGCDMPRCGASYADKMDLFNHMKDQHLDLSVVETPYRCAMPGCTKKYKNINGLQYHIKDATGLSGHSDEAALQAERPFKCLVSGCKSAYKNANGLRYHQIHSHAPASSVVGHHRHRKKGPWGNTLGMLRPPPIAPAPIPPPPVIIRFNIPASRVQPMQGVPISPLPSSMPSITGFSPNSVVAVPNSPPTSPTTQTATVEQSDTTLLPPAGSTITPPTSSAKSTTTTPPAPNKYSPPPTSKPTSKPVSTSSLTQVQTAISTSVHPPLSPTTTTPPLSRRHAPDPVIVAKRQERLIKNRAAARLSRKRKMEHIERLTADNGDLRDRLTELEVEAAAARVERDSVVNENEELKRKVRWLEEEAGRKGMGGEKERQEIDGERTDMVF
ncbi:hypothetical protein BC937DRAFT_92540 [Endogone sp. FLAS-F59071]|nr:hypothetical protein BC937DRAFT_92540 [Endogone sp. FLAS-F59071]|eukprot:RUS15367.1 hypothetical protein BC937DRAFT_92540 [Endogone sp. FLAS-F59071]